MRKDISFAIAATVLALTILMWAKSSVAPADIVRPKLGVGTYEVRPAPYPPIQALEPVW
jgi:hypothetical protein